MFRRAIDCNMAHDRMLPKPSKSNHGHHHNCNADTHADTHEHKRRDTSQTQEFLSLQKWEIMAIITNADCRHTCVQPTKAMKAQFDTNEGDEIDEEAEG